MFEGDAPTVENYAFTGGGMHITKVVFSGKSFELTTDTFNSTSAALPACYYPVYFYPSKEDMEAGTNLLGKAVVSNEVELGRINVDLASSYVYSGSIPTWPEGTNLWSFKDTSSYTGVLTGTAAAYPISSEYRDLSKGAINATTYMCTSAGKTYYTGLPIDPDAIVTDLIGLDLVENVDYGIVYERQDEAGTWQKTSDFTNPGVIRMTATACDGGRYHGTVQSTLTIAFEVGATFMEPVDVTDSDGAVETVDCWFKLTNLENGTGTVEVSKGHPLIRTYTSKNTYNLTYPFAIPTSTQGFVTIPSSFDKFGNTFSVTSIATDAFGTDSKKETGCSAMSGVEIPAGITNVGDNAFRGCTSLQKVVFRGDASTITWGQTIFKSDANIQTVVWYGKKATSRFLFNASSPTYSSDPVNYYQVTYYASKDDVSAGKALGHAVLREGQTIALLSEATDLASGLYEGTVPDYPDRLIDDGKWFAPTWVYPGVDEDNSRALFCELSDSCYAYAAQTNDAYTVDDAHLLDTGFTDGQEFAYTGSTAVDVSKMKVVSAIGRKLTEKVDYTVSFQRKSTSEEGVWEDTDNLSDAGTLRMVVTGIGAYSGTISQSFTILSPVFEEGSTFTAPLDLVQDDGSQKTVDCTFKVTKLGDMGTVTLGDGTSAAISTASKGALTVPDQVAYQGLTFSVTGISAYAFKGCAALTSADTTSAVEAIGANAFANCWSLKSATIASCTDAGSSVFASCASLTLVTLGSGVTSIGDSWFSGCAKLSELNYTTELTSIGAAAFSKSGMKSLSVSGELASGLTADVFTGSSISNVDFEEGVTSIPANLFTSNTTLKTVKLPTTLTSIGSMAFAASGLTTLALPDASVYLGFGAFSSCSSLSTVVFEGDPLSITYDNPPFAATNNIQKVVYRKSVLQDASTLFPYSKGFDSFATVTFFASDADQASGISCGQAVVRIGTTYKAIDGGTLNADELFDGAVPAYPEGSNIWEFDGNPPLTDTISDSCSAVAQSQDVSDLANAHVVTKAGYYYQDSVSNDPFAGTTGSVVDAKGNVLKMGSHYTIRYQRRDANGTWADTTDLTSRGGIRVVATAVEGGGYRGTGYGQFSITNYLVGDTFTAVEENGVAVTYQVTKVADEVDPGSVSVGRGSKDQQAIASDTAGAVSIPSTVKDPNAMSYVPTSVSDYALYRFTGVTKVTLSSSIARIGTKAFAYVASKTDTKISTLSTLVLNCDMSVARVAGDAFIGCDAIKTIVYGSRKGTFSAFGASTGIQRYYTACYYLSEADRAAGTVAARVVAKEGSFLFSLSKTDYWTGSDTVPMLDDTHEWAYDETALDAEERLCDSCDVTSRIINDDTVYADVTLLTEEGTSSAECLFTKMRDGEGEFTGAVTVGAGVDGTVAVSRATAGTVVIPSSVKDASGASFTVTGVGAYAFGSEEEGRACTTLTGIQLPASVTSIGQAAFDGCSSLESACFDAASTLEEVGPAAFANATALTGIDLPDSTTTIGTAAFSGSGLVRIHVPASVTDVGKRAFSGCTDLREAVFDGAQELDLPALDGMDADTSGHASGTSDACTLSMIDDYTFGNCTQLERVVFNGNMSATTTSDEAFAGCTSLATVVYGSGKGKVSFSNSKPTTYVTMSYYHRASDRDALARCGYVIVAQGTTFSTRADASTYAGVEPSIEDHYEWVYASDVDVPMRDSSYAYGDKIHYALDTSGVDAAFDCTFTVDGAEVESACYGDAVSVSVTSGYAVQPTLITCTNSADGTVLLQMAGDSSGGFTMPGAIVRVSVDAEAPLTVSSQKPAGEAVLAGRFTLADMRALAAQSQPVDYSATGITGQTTVVRASENVALSTLLDRCGIVFESGDSLVLFNGGEIAGTISYDKLNGVERFYYPHADIGETDDAASVSATIAITTAQSKSETDLGTASLCDAYRLCFGQTESDMTDCTDTESLMTSQITDIVVLKGAEDISDAVLGDIAKDEAYTGDSVEPVPTVTLADGTELQAGRDFEVSYEGNVEPGIATLTCTGIGNYRGSVQTTFRILCAMELAGTNACGTAAAIAMEAYPQGSTGVIVATDATYYDALSASALAGLLDYPLLLTHADSLSSDTATALSFLSDGKSGFQVIVMGGEAAITSNVESKISDMIGSGNDVSRIGGQNAYETSYLVWRYGALLSDGWSDTVIVASGNSFADALSISPWAVKTGSPIMICDGDALTSSFVQAVQTGGATKAIIVGGSAAVSDSVGSWLQGTLGGDNVTQLAGQNMYETSLAIAEWEISDGGMSDECVSIATGASFQDALTGGPLAAADDGPIILAEDGNQTTYRLLSSHADQICLARFLGGTAATTDTMRTAALDALRWDYALLP